MDCTEEKEKTMYWNLDEEGTLCVSGDGKMPNYSCGRNPLPPWYEIREQIRQVEIGNGITELGIRAFDGCTNLETVYLPDSAERIHAECFSGCTKLEEICTAQEAAYRFVYDDAPESGREDWKAKRKIIFGINSFYGVPWALRRWGLYYISGNCLMVCFSEESEAVIPEGVEAIGKFAFSKVPLVEVKLPESLQRIEEFAFEYVKLEELAFPEGLRYVGYGAFSGSSLKKAVVPVSACIEFDPGAFSETAIRLPVRWKKRRPSLYEIAGCSSGMPGFRKLKLRERRATASRGIVGIPALHVGDAVLNRIKRGTILICIQWDESMKKVTAVKSFRWIGGAGFPEEYLMYPCYENDEKREGVSIWSDSFTYLDNDDITCSFPERVDEELLQSGKLRDSNRDAEEWFSSSDRENYGGPLELHLLEKWLKRHPGYRLDSTEENREESAYRWFVSC